MTYEYNTGGVIDPSRTGMESSLSPYVGDYVVDMLGRGRAAASQPYQAYTGPLTAGVSDLQSSAFTGIGSLTTPTMGVDSITDPLETPMTVADPMGQAGETTQVNTVAGQYMNPYIQAALTPQIDELRRQADISRMENARRLTGAGAYGGSRQAIMDAELDRNLLRSVSDLGATQYATAYDKAVNQFNREQEDRNRYGFNVLSAQQAAGDIQRGILGEGITADQRQFVEERDYPLKTSQYMQSLLQNLPLESQSYQFKARDPVDAGLAGLGAGVGAAGDILGSLRSIYDFFKS
jgi:hypothetical protein